MGRHKRVQRLARVETKMLRVARMAARTSDFALVPRFVGRRAGCRGCRFLPLGFSQNTARGGETARVLPSPKPYDTQVRPRGDVSSEHLGELIRHDGSFTRSAFAF